MNINITCRNDSVCSSSITDLRYGKAIRRSLRFNVLWVMVILHGFGEIFIHQFDAVLLGHLVNRDVRIVDREEELRSQVRIVDVCCVPAFHSTPETN